MYSVMLMAALSAAPSSQTWHRGHHGHCGTYCHSSCGCGHYGHGSAYGYYGCYGCYGYPWYGCGWHSGSSVFHGYLGTPFQCHGCYGCYGGWSCYGMPIQQVIVEPAGPMNPPLPGERKTDKKPGKFEETPAPKGNKPGEEQVRAKVTIDVPADAKLYIDGNLMKSITGRRTFQTPDLVPGNTYFYDLKAEVVRDGRLISANQRVVLRPGEQAIASFVDLGKTTDATAQAGQR